MSEPSRRRPPRILCVTTDPTVVCDLRSCLGEGAELDVHEDAERAAELLRARPFAGALFDSQLADRRAVQLANDFIRHQPTGRAIVSCRDADATTLLGIAARDPRVEVVFRPWDHDEVRERLLGRVAMGEFTGAARPRDVLARLLDRD